MISTSSNKIDEIVAPDEIETLCFDAVLFVAGVQ